MFFQGLRTKKVSTLFTSFSIREALAIIFACIADSTTPATTKAGTLTMLRTALVAVVAMGMARRTAGKRPPEVAAGVVAEAGAVVRRLRRLDSPLAGRERRELGSLGCCLEKTGWRSLFLSSVLGITEASPAAFLAYQSRPRHATLPLGFAFSIVSLNPLSRKSRFRNSQVCRLRTSP